MFDRLNNVSNESVQQATGRTWDEWVTLLDQAGMADKPHKHIAAWLMESGQLPNGWWAQSVTVGYEYAKGKRMVGQTTDVGFQIGVQRTIPVGKEKIWRVLHSPKGKALWASKAKIEMRSQTEGEKMRMRWQPEDRPEPTTLQITLDCPRNETDKTNVRFHQEKLASGDERERMRQHWQQVLKQLEEMAAG